MSKMIIHRSGKPKSYRRHKRDKLHWPFVDGDLDPFADMVDFNRSLYGLIPRYFEYAAPRLNMKDEGDRYVIEADTPGYTENNLEIVINERQLTLRGEVKTEKKESKEEEEDEDDDGGGKYLIHEVSHKKFVRTLNLPRNANVDKATANLKDGVLTLTLPKYEDCCGPKKIEITK